MNRIKTIRLSRAGRVLQRTLSTGAAAAAVLLAFSGPAGAGNNGMSPLKSSGPSIAAARNSSGE
jgi:hypothetical protein